MSVPRGSRWDENEYRHDRDGRVFKHSDSAGKLRRILADYLRNELTGKQFYTRAVRILDNDLGLRNEFMDEYVELEQYAANEMAHRGSLYSKEDSGLSELVQRLYYELSRATGSS